MSNIKRLLQIPPFATVEDITRTVNHIINKLIPGYSDPAVDTDWDNLTSPGLYLNSASASNAPALTATEYYCLTLAYANSDDRAQIAFPYDVADGLYIRNYYAGSWSVWTGSSGGGTGTVTDFSFTDANGFTGTVTNSTSTPNLTLDGNNLLSLMGDVTITSPSDTQVLTYVAADSKWENKAAPSGFSNPMTTKGDVIYEDATPAPNRLAIGTTGQVLTVSSGLPAWGAATPLTTKGDIMIENATPAPDRLAIGTTGQVLTVASGLPSWATPSTGMTNPMTTKGDIIFENATPAPDRLGIGITQQSLIVSGSGLPVWGGAAANANVQTFTSNGIWTLPANQTFSQMQIICIGNGGNGGNGAKGNSGVVSGGGGGGGGGGARAIVTINSQFVPPTLYVFVGAGGSGSSSTYVSINNDTGGLVANNTFAYANGGTNGGNGATNGASGTAGGAAATPALTNMWFGNFFATELIAGIAGGAGSGPSGSVTINIATGGTGGGDGATGPAPAIGYAGGALLARGLAGPVAGGVGGTSGGGDGSNGIDGVAQIIAGMFYPVGGTGGGSPGTITGGGGNGSGGNGGAGSYGSGGGGGGGIYANATTGIVGTGGAGGSGIVIITVW